MRSVSRLRSIRLTVLATVNALIALHIFAYYALDARSIGCVDFLGLGTFLGKGEITAGTVFFFALIGLTLLFGRIFCGWGCHFAFFQDKVSSGIAARLSLHYETEYDGDATGP